MTTTTSTLPITTPLTPADDERYPFQQIEARWRTRWAEADVYRTTESETRPPYYVLDMFPYPSGSGLHIGHCRNYVPGDVVGRFKHMQGHAVLHPMGWDAFGQPAEQDAIRRKVNPRTVVPQLAAEYKRQLMLLGNGYDWNREINSSDPSYYKWNQWAFLLFLERGLAYRKNAPVNWCVNENSVLANEEVENGTCWRCGGPVIKKNLAQWFYKITEYADKLIEGLDRIEWPDGVKIHQREWIGRSEGAEVNFNVTVSDEVLAVFTTRPDTLWGATFMVLAPEHPLVERITTLEQRSEVTAYQESAKRMSEIERQNVERTKTGVFTGAYADNPVTGEPIPIFIADYVLTGYGTGAIMAVPAHDERDFEFAKKYDLPIVLVYADDDQTDELTEAKPSGGTMRSFPVPAGSSAKECPFVGFPNNKETVSNVIDWLEAVGIGTRKINFKLRDWLVSRQRYWGTPIPIIHCPDCGIVPVPLDQLPVLLPDIENYAPSPDGRSPLATVPEFVQTTCPTCGGAAERETDTMAGSVDSSWYFLRFTSPHENAEPWDRTKADYWLPVDRYIGGREHAVGHLLYARFFTKVFFDADLVGFDEPFTRLSNQGALLAMTNVDLETGHPIRPEEMSRFESSQIGHQWLRMSKSKGNAITPDEIAERYGADSLRLYVLFVAPFEDTIQWNEDAMNGTYRFLVRVWSLITNIGAAYQADWSEKIGGATTTDERALRRRTHQAIAKMTGDITDFRFNTAVSELMKFTDTLRKFTVAHGTTSPATHEAADTLLKLLAPLAPHIADELWERLGHSGEFLYHVDWPLSDAALAAEEEITLVVQVNGKVRDKITLPADADTEACEHAALASDKVISAMEGKTPKKVVVIPGRLVNIVL